MITELPTCEYCKKNKAFTMMNSGWCCGDCILKIEEMKKQRMKEIINDGLEKNFR